MSHFNVLVINKHGARDIDDIMAPYSESLETAPRIYKTKQEMIEDEKKRLANIPNKALVQEYLKDPEAFKANGAVEPGERYKIKLVEDLLEQHRKYLAGEYKSDEDFYQSALDFRDPSPDMIDDDGNLLTTYNNNAKYDYYVEGGRWDGMLILKDGTTANTAPFRDIDWDAMNKLTPEQEKNIHDVWRLHVRKEGTWKERKEFKKEHPFLYIDAYYLECYGTEEEHLRRASLWQTFAVVKENRWYGKGEMGWFGASSETEEEGKVWADSFEERFIKNCDPDDELTILDCHI